jgi:hypothetical protein
MKYLFKERSIFFFKRIFYLNLEYEVFVRHTYGPSTADLEVFWTDGHWDKDSDVLNDEMPDVY